MHADNTRPQKGEVGYRKPPHTTPTLPPPPPPDLPPRASCLASESFRLGLTMTLALRAHLLPFLHRCQLPSPPSPTPLPFLHRCQLSSPLLPLFPSLAPVFLRCLPVLHCLSSTFSSVILHACRKCTCSYMQVRYGHRVVC